MTLSEIDTAVLSLSERNRITKERSTCGTCRHYGDSRLWSAHCQLGAPDWAYKGDTLVRADNSCPRWEAVASDLIRRAA